MSRVGGLKEALESVQAFHKEDIGDYGKKKDKGQDKEVKKQRDKKGKEGKGREGKESKEKKDRDGKKHKDRDRDRSRRRREKDREKRRRRRKRDAEQSSDGEEDEEASSSSAEDGSDKEQPIDHTLAQAHARALLRAYPAVGGDLEALAARLDKGEAVDILGLEDALLAGMLVDVFKALGLKQRRSALWAKRSKKVRLLALLAPVLQEATAAAMCSRDEASSPPVAGPLPAPEDNGMQHDDDHQQQQQVSKHDEACDGAVEDAEETPVVIGPAAMPPPKPRVIGPARPPPELLASVAEDAEEQGGEDFIGPAPPALVAEAAAASEDDRNAQVKRIMELRPDADAYEVVGVDHDAAAAAIRKHYWRISLLVHPDKCSHPHAHEAFSRLNKARLQLLDPEKRAAVDAAHTERETRKQFEAELAERRQAAMWRKQRGEAPLQGDEDLLRPQSQSASGTVREDWMTELPPERKAGHVDLKSRQFSRNERSGRGDTSGWTDSPADAMKRNQQQFLQSSAAKEEAIAELQAKKASATAQLVDEYNSHKRQKTLLEQHQDAQREERKKKKKGTKQDDPEWAAEHPWQPWDRDKDLAAGPKAAASNSKQRALQAAALSSRFGSSGPQRSFL
eukprot:jgi/Chlat1/9139/Chrsp97S08431